MKPIKIGQIGIGHNHADEKMRTLRSLPHLFEVVGIVEADPAWREKRGGQSQYKGLRWMTEAELFDTTDLEAVAVETDGSDLIPTAARCAERGLHMHLDKPGGESLPDFKALLDTCERRGLAIQLGYMYRNNPAINFCREAVRSGWLGDIFEVHAVMSRLDGDDYRKWVANFKGGSLYIFGGYLIDIIISLLGRPENVTSFQRPTRDDGCHDNGFAVLEYPRATASVRASIVEVEGFRRRQLVVCGTKGTVEICPLEHHNSRYELDPLHVRLTLSEPCGDYAAGTHVIDVGVMHGRYTEQLTELARVIRGEIKNPWPSSHEFHVHETLLAASGYNTFT
ncbi:MAG: dehydrogenase [Puniceicoccaceae bacterium]|nr:dehydrogenase [Puniceicoccaceae bacterium]|tara:strand:- start:1063 stop:2076 length:1014 start_codon:yes stop_codon:yes gene_type:complete